MKNFNAEEFYDNFKVFAPRGLNGILTSYSAEVKREKLSFIMEVVTSEKGLEYFKIIQCFGVGKLILPNESIDSLCNWVISR